MTIFRLSSMPSNQRIVFCKKCLKAKRRQQQDYTMSKYTRLKRISGNILSLMISSPSSSISNSAWKRDIAQAMWFQPFWMLIPNARASKFGLFCCRKLMPSIIRVTIHLELEILLISFKRLLELSFKSLTYPRICINWAN